MLGEKMVLGEKLWEGKGKSSGEGSSYFFNYLFKLIIKL
jgi:hypothetical protein